MCPYKKSLETFLTTFVYKITKAKGCSADGNTDYFDIVAYVLQGYTLASYLHNILLDYVIKTSINLMKENGFRLAKERSRRYSARTITDCADDIALIAIALTQAESLLHRLEGVTGGIGLNVNADKIE